MSDRDSVRMRSIPLKADDWDEATVNERKPEPRVTLADLHGMMGKLAKEVRILAIVVALTALVEVARVFW